MMNGNNIITGVIAGALVGTVLGLMVAPKPGKETRQIVASRAGEWRIKAGDYVGTLRQKIQRDAQANGVEELSNEHMISAN
jgi:gas vesicle protein